MVEFWARTWLAQTVREAEEAIRNEEEARSQWDWNEYIRLVLLRNLRNAEERRFYGPGPGCLPYGWRFHPANATRRSQQDQGLGFGGRRPVLRSYPLVGTRDYIRSRLIYHLSKESDDGLQSLYP